MNIEILINDVSASQSLLGPDEELLAFEDKRHGVKGYRVSRYVRSQRSGHLDWDESYMFYESLDDVITAFKTKDYEAGREAF